MQKQYGPMSEPTPTYTHSPGPHETESQRPQVQRQLTKQTVIFEDDASYRPRPERIEAEAHEPPPPPRASSQYLETRSTGFERNALGSFRSDRGLDLKPKFDDMFKPQEDVYPWHTESRPEFHISPKECPYPPIIHPYDGNLDSDPSRGPLMPLLQFWTWYAQLNVISRPKDAQAEAGLHQDLERCSIADDNGDWCGSIVLDRAWVKGCKDARQEFVAISEAKAFSELECDSWTYYIPKERDESEWDVFHVLLIERKEEKWERVGLGKVFKEAFLRTTEWREIMLG
ncbi:hypothetical protein NX059_011957 [Plenodomus lindquistii]|nr:hypothetical protein NX059_011957 [Plenodomus lindquistii]